MIQLPTEKTLGQDSGLNNVFLFYGPVGVGKTWFVNKIFGQAVFISTDRGTREIEALRIEVSNYLEVDEALRLLTSAKKKYDAVVFDHIDDISTYIESYVCEKLKIETLFDKQWGGGWAVYKTFMRRTVMKLTNMGLAVVFIGHDQTTKLKFYSKEIDRTVPKMSKIARDAIIPLCQIVGYCSSELKKGGDGNLVTVRRLYTQPTEELEVKDRSRRQKPPNGIEKLDGKLFASTFRSQAKQD